MSCVIEVDNLSFTYPDGTKALDGVSLRVGHGEKVGLVGANGSGKSTFLLALSGFIWGEGKIVIGGIELTKRSVREVRRVITSVLQDPNDQLFMPTLYEDAAFGPMNMGLGAEEIRRRAMRALERVGLAEKAEKPPHHLSAGQKRAAAIATVLSMDPKIITMDEPETSLDGRNRRNIAEILRGLEQTLLIATCDVSFAACVCERLVVIDGGRIVAEGQTREIIEDMGLLERCGLV